MVETTDRVRALFEKLHEEAISLRQTWLLYQQLYGPLKHVEVMQKSALVSFGLIQKVLRESIVLAIQRFLDPATTSRKETASLEQLIRMIPHKKSNAEVRRQAKRDRARLIAVCEDIEQHRNRQLAHLDFATVMMEHPEPLDDIAIKSVHEAVDGIQEVLRKIGNHLYASEIWTFQGAELDGDTLMFLLEAGRKQHPPLTFPPT